jgi:hypothetical protein
MEVAIDALTVVGETWREDAKTFDTKTFDTKTFDTETFDSKAFDAKDLPLHDACHDSAVVKQS